MTRQLSINEKLDFLMSRINELEKEVDYLKGRLSKYENPKNSGNSNRPPSSDFPKVQKTQSLREQSGKKPGGQPGHKGTTLKMCNNPDVVLSHNPNYCTCCGEDLSGYDGQLAGSRQVIDIPPIKPVITEHDVYRTSVPVGFATCLERSNKKLSRFMNPSGNWYWRARSLAPMKPGPT